MTMHDYVMHTLSRFVLSNGILQNVSRPFHFFLNFFVYSEYLTWLRKCIQNLDIFIFKCGRLLQLTNKSVWPSLM